MVRGKRMICFCFIAGILIGATGCQNKKGIVLETTSLDTEKQTEVQQDTEKPAAESQQDTDPLSVGNQLKTIAGYAEKWRKMESQDDPFESMNYAVTDLDQNGRLEIIASSGQQGSGRFTYTDYFQVNQAGDGLKKLKTSSMAGSDIVKNISTAYFDPDIREYHYITSDFASAGAAVGYYTAVTSLTLRGNKIVDEPLGYKDVVVKNGKEKPQYFYTYSQEGNTDSPEKRKMRASEFSVEEISSKAYAKCGKLSVNISWFSFERSLNDMTEEQMIYYLKRSYEAFRLGEPLQRKEKERCSKKSYEDVDWEEYQYRMSPEEYRALQEYMPVLTGGEAFIWTEERITKGQITVSEREKVTISQFLEKKREGKENVKERSRLEDLDYVSLCDLTGDGKLALLLSMDEYEIDLLLHREGDLYYGLDFDKEKLWFEGLQTDGICVRDPDVGEFYYRITFENGMFQEEMLGGYQYGGDEDDVYYVKGKKVREATFDAWYEDIESKAVGEYIPVCEQ